MYAICNFTDYPCIYGFIVRPLSEFYYRPYHTTNTTTLVLPLLLLRLFIQCRTEGAGAVEYVGEIKDQQKQVAPGRANLASRPTAG